MTCDDDACRLSFVHEMMERFHGAAALHVLPSYVFSAALADYFAYKDELQSAGAIAATATGVHSAGDNPALDVKLVNALLTFPTALVALVKALQDQVGYWRFLVCKLQMRLMSHAPT